MEIMPLPSAFFPLRDAVLCLECEFIAQPEDDKCLVCGQKTLVRLAELLEALIEKACTTHPPIALADLAKLVPLSNSCSHGPIAKNPA